MNKVKQIIDNEFDSRLGLAVLSYALGQLGQDQAASLTDEDIEKAEGNALMTKDFVQSLMKCAREVAKTSFCDDIIPYIVEEYGYLSKAREIAEKIVAINEYHEMNPCGLDEIISNIHNIERSLINGDDRWYIEQMEEYINEGTYDDEFVEMCEEVLYMLKARKQNEK